MDIDPAIPGKRWPFFGFGGFICCFFTVMFMAFGSLSVPGTANMKLELQQLEASWETTCTLQVASDMAKVASAMSVEVQVGQRGVTLPFIEFRCAVDVRYEGDIMNRAGEAQAYVFAGYGHSSGDAGEDERKAESACLKRLGEKSWANVLIYPAGGLGDAAQPGWGCGDGGYFFCTYKPKQWLFGPSTQDMARKCEFYFGDLLTSKTGFWQGMPLKVAYSEGSCPETTTLSGGVAMPCAVDDAKQVRLGGKAALEKVLRDWIDSVTAVCGVLTSISHVLFVVMLCCCCGAVGDKFCVGQDGAQARVGIDGEESEEPYQAVS